MHSKKTKHKTAQLDISEYDMELFYQYNEYIKIVCATNEDVGYLCANELLRKLNHFNFADRLVAKVLNGTRSKGNIGKECANTIIEQIKNSNEGEILFIILDQCLDYEYTCEIIEGLADSEYLHRCVAKRIEKELKYDKEYNERRKKEKKMEKRDRKGYLARKEMYGKIERKNEKIRLKKEKEVRDEELTGMGNIEEKNYTRTVNALQRLIFTILKERRKECYSAVFRAIKEYEKLIRQEFREGLYVLLHDAISECDDISKLDGLDTLLFIYKDSGFDFKRVINHLYGLIHPYRSTLQAAQFNRIGELVNELFIEKRQPIGRVIVFVQRLMLLRIARCVELVTNIVKNLEVAYDIEFTEHVQRNSTVCDFDNSGQEDVDRVPARPFYEYYIYKSII